jgi:hypothetical protein
MIVKKEVRRCLKNFKKFLGGWGCSSVIKCLPKMFKVLAGTLAIHTNTHTHTHTHTRKPSL